MSAVERILVTGGAGKLGQALGRAGCNALGRDRLDITAPAQIAAVLEAQRPDIVINTASYTAVDAAEQEEDRAHAINGAGAGNIAAFCAATGIPLIHISTDMVFDSGDPGSPLDEKAWTAPQSVYGASKLEGETLVRSAGGRHTVARVSWLFGETGESFVSRILTVAKGRDTLNVVTDEVGRPTPLDDLAAHLIKLAGRMVDGQDSPSLIHLGPAPAVSRFDWAQEIFSVSAEAGGPAPKLTPVPASTFETPARRPRGVILDTRLGDDLLGPMPDWRTACEKAVRALLA